MKEYKDRFYRRRISRKDLVSFEVRVKETDLLIRADRELSKPAMDLALKARERLESYIGGRPDFASSMTPLPYDPFAPKIARDMLAAAEKAGVGPMAAVAGAIAEYVGQGLLDQAREVMVENGGDLFIKVDRPVIIGLFAGESKFNEKIGLEALPEESPMGICSSSGTIGHSISFGAADLACVKSKSTALADAAATALGNRVKNAGDIHKALEWSKTVEGILGALIIVGDRMGAWGSMKLVAL